MWGSEHRLGVHYPLLPAGTTLSRSFSPKMDGDTAYPVGLFESSRDIASKVLGMIPSA